MRMIRDIKQVDINKYIIEHPTFLEGIKIPDTHIEEFFTPTPIQLLNIKNKFYTYMRLSLDQLIDIMSKGFEYKQALRIIKAHGFGLPLRVARWGYQEPLTVDELLDKLEKNSKHWERVFENSVERKQVVERKKRVTQKTLSNKQGE